MEAPGKLTAVRTRREETPPDDRRPAAYPQQKGLPW